MKYRLACFSVLALASIGLASLAAVEVKEDVEFYHSPVSPKVWNIVKPYLMPESHPLKAKLDRIFSKFRVLENTESLTRAGFIKKEPRSHSRAIVIRHKEMPRYIFKIYTDDKMHYYRDEPEHITWMLRARGAKLVREAIEKLGYQEYFKAPHKWIYALPGKPKAKKGMLQKNFILVEDEMDLLPWDEIRQRWLNGTITINHLDMLFSIINEVGLRGGCKYDNIPICKDGKLAFIDTQNHLGWPLPYSRLLSVLQGEMRSHWEALMQTVETESPSTK